LTGSLEVVSPALDPKFAGFVDDLRLYAFDDGGALWSLQPLHGQTQAFTLESAGMGLRVTLLRHLKGDVAVGVPFIAGAATHADRPRVTFSLKSDF
jgi:hemolysin activation/secretion protein